MIELKKRCLAAVLVFFLFLFTGCDGSSPDPGTVNGGVEVIAPVFIGSAEARDMNVSPSREDVAELYYKWYAPSFISFKPVEMTSDTYPVVILGTPVNLKVTVSDKTVTYTGKSAHEKIYLELEYNMETDKFDYYQCFVMEDSSGMEALLLSSGKGIQVNASVGSFSGDISFIVMHYNNPGIEVEGVKYPVFVGDCHLYSDGTNSGTLVYQSNDSESEPDSYLTYSELTKIDDPLFSFNYTDGNELKNHFDDDINMKQYYVFCYYKGGQYCIEPTPSGYTVNSFENSAEASEAVSEVFPDWKISPESTVSEQYE